MGRGNFLGKGRPIVKYRDSAANRAKTADAIEMPFVALSRVDPRNYVLDGGSDLLLEWAILREEGTR